MVDKVLADIANAFITLTNSPYDITDAGVYNLQVTYSWALPILTKVVNFTLTVTDICTTKMNPSLIQPTYLLYLGDPN